MCTCSCVVELRVAVTLSRNCSKLEFFSDFSKNMSSEDAKGRGGVGARSALFCMLMDQKNLVRPTRPKPSS
jgi:hypothetical protein